MLPPAHRLRRGSDFTITTRNGTRSSRGRVVAYVHPSGSNGPAKAGLIVGKVVGNSVVRHRVSRQIRAALAPVMTHLPAGYLVVVRVLAGASNDEALRSDVVTAVESAVRRVEGRSQEHSRA